MDTSTFSVTSSGSSVQDHKEFLALDGLYETSFRLEGNPPNPWLQIDMNRDYVVQGAIVFVPSGFAYGGMEVSLAAQDSPSVE